MAGVGVAEIRITHLPLACYGRQINSGHAQRVGPTS